MLHHYYYYYHCHCFCYCCCCCCTPWCTFKNATDIHQTYCYTIIIVRTMAFGPLERWSLCIQSFGALLPCRVTPKTSEILHTASLINKKHFESEYWKYRATSHMKFLELCKQSSLFKAERLMRNFTGVLQSILCTTTTRRMTPIKPTHKIDVDAYRFQPISLANQRACHNTHEDYASVKEIFSIVVRPWRNSMGPAPIITHMKWTAI